MSVILSHQMSIPLHCSQCHSDMAVNLNTIKNKNPHICEHCDYVHHLSDTELQVLKLVLSQAGFYFNS